MPLIPRTYMSAAGIQSETGRVTLGRLAGTEVMYKQQIQRYKNQLHNLIHHVDKEKKLLKWSMVAYNRKVSDMKTRRQQKKQDRVSFMKLREQERKIDLKTFYKSLSEKCSPLDINKSPCVGSNHDKNGFERDNRKPTSKMDISVKEIDWKRSEIKVNTDTENRQRKVGLQHGRSNVTLEFPTTDTFAIRKDQKNHSSNKLEIEKGGSEFNLSNVPLISIEEYVDVPKKSRQSYIKEDKDQLLVELLRVKQARGSIKGLSQADKTSKESSNKNNLPNTNLLTVNYNSILDSRTNPLPPIESERLVLSRNSSNFSNVSIGNNMEFDIRNTPILKITAGSSKPIFNVDHSALTREKQSPFSFVETVQKALAKQKKLPKLSSPDTTNFLRPTDAFRPDDITIHGSTYNRKSALARLSLDEQQQKHKVSWQSALQKVRECHYLS